MFSRKPLTEDGAERDDRIGVSCKSDADAADADDEMRRGPQSRLVQTEAVNEPTDGQPGDGGAGHQFLFCPEVQSSEL